MALFIVSLVSMDQIPKSIHFRRGEKHDLEIGVLRFYINPRDLRKYPIYFFDRSCTFDKSKYTLEFFLKNNSIEAKVQATARGHLAI